MGSGVLGAAAARGERDKGVKCAPLPPVVGAGAGAGAGEGEAGRVWRATGEGVAKAEVGAAECEEAEVVVEEAGVCAGVEAEDREGEGEGEGASCALRWWCHCASATRGTSAFI
jgi:hypothetical protein